MDQIREVLTDSGYDVELAIVTLLQIMELKENGSITFTYQIVKFCSKAVKSTFYNDSFISFRLHVLFL